MNKLGLDRAEERLHRCSLRAVALAAHGGFDAVAVENLPVRSGGVLHTTIGMVGEALGWCAMLDRHHQRVLAQGTPQIVGHTPADDLAGRHVLDGRQVQPALVVATYVMSASQIVFGRSASKARWSRLGAMP